MDHSSAPLLNEIVDRLVKAGAGDIARVFLIGSRALGTHTQDSDVDLVVLIEPRLGRRWSVDENQGEKARLLQHVGDLPVPIELWVRSVDRFAVAKDVVGGVEYLADKHGVRLFARPLRRRPRPQQSSESIRRENVGIWLAHAVAAENAAVRAGRSAMPRGGSAAEAPLPAEAALERAIGALLTYRGCECSKTDGVTGMLKKLASVDVSAWQSLHRFEAQPQNAATARAAVEAAMLSLQTDGKMLPHIEFARRQRAEGVLLTF